MLHTCIGCLLPAQSMPSDKKGAGLSHSGKRQRLPGNEGTLAIHYNVATVGRGYTITSASYKPRTATKKTKKSVFVNFRLIIVYQPSKSGLGAQEYHTSEYDHAAPESYHVKKKEVIKIHSSCGIEDFVETHICKLCTLLRSRVLLGVSSIRI